MAPGLFHLEAQAQRRPEHPALVFHDPETGRGAPLTYAALNDEVNQISQGLRGLGLAPGSGIAALTGTHREALVLYFAAMRLGLWYTPLNMHLKAQEIGQIVEDAGAKALFYRPAYAAQLPPPGSEYREDTATLWARCADLPKRCPEDAQEGAALLFSSGTTGRPKGVITAQPGAPLGTQSALAAARIQAHGLDENTVYLSTAPLYHSAPLRYIDMVLRLGGTAQVLTHFDAETALGVLEAEPITHSQWVPTMFVRLLRLPEARREAFRAQAHRYAIHAAAPCPPAVKAAMIDWWGPILYEYYSATEANGQTVIDSPEWLAHRGSVGRPLLGEVSIRDAHGVPCPPGVAGTVYLRGGATFSYLGDPEKTREAYLEDGFSTVGDLGYLDEEGFLYLTDRRDFTVISGGVNIYPREIEDVLLADPRVADAAVFGLPDEEFGERLHASVELVSGVDPTGMEAALRAHCRAQLAHLKCPKSWLFHEQLPRLPTGKLAKHRLRDEVLASLGLTPPPAAS